MLGQTVVLAESGIPFPPSVEDFFLPSVLPWGGHNVYWFTKITLLVWLAVAALIIYFLVSYRNPQLVPTKKQWFAESIYGFVRNNIAVDMIGHAGVRFAPYFTTLFCFILLTNLFAIIPVFQISPNSHIAFPAFLTIVLMPFTYSITVGIGAGFVAYVAIKVLRGKSGQVHALMWAVAALFVVYFAIDPIKAILGVS